MRRLGSTLGLGLLAAATGARANGRPPNTISVDINPLDPNQWVVGTTFGLGLSRDCGRSFRYVCENVIVNRAATFESAQGFTGGDFRVVFGTQQEILIEGGPAARSVDGGISWTSMQGLPQPETGEATFGRLAGSSVANRAYLPYYDREASYGKDQSGVSTAYRTDDAGAHWRQLGGLVAPGVNLFVVAEVPAHPERLIGIGQAVNTFTGPWVTLSEDAGVSWSAPQLAPISWLPPVPAAGAPAAQLNQILLARHPTDAQRLWLAGVVDTPAQPGQATLLGSTDGGRSFAQLVLLPSAVRNLAVAADGAEVWAALGDSSSQGNVYHAEDGTSFAPLSWPRTNSCVARLGSMTLVCGNTQGDGYSLAVSGDGGRTLHRGMQLSQLVLEPFPAGSMAAERCGRAWPTYAEAVGANPAPGGPAPAVVAPQVDLGGLCDGSLTAQALAASETTRAVPAEVAGGTGPGEDGNAAPAAAAAGRGRGCACRADGSTGAGELGGWLAMALAGGVRRLRRRPGSGGGEVDGDVRV